MWIMGTTIEERQSKKSAQQSSWLLANPDYHANYRRTHREERKAYNARYQQEHQIERAAYKAAYDAEHAEEKAEYTAQYQKDNRDQTNAKTARWRIAHPEAKRASEARRRVRKYQGVVEDFLDTEIFERDNYICGLCNEVIDREFPSRHPMSVTLDHILPISKGGHHTRANVQAAHFVCNMRKGNR
jgi:5-methylcytosine-specific restriction endonuclease McrA